MYREYSGVQAQEGSASQFAAIPTHRTNKRERGRACARIASGFAIAATALTIAVPTAYSLPAGYRPGYVQGGPGATQAAEGVTEEERAMIQDVYNGFLASTSGSYQTEKFYRISPSGNWNRALEVCYFHSDGPGGMKLYYENGDRGSYQVIIEKPRTDMDAFRQKVAAYDAEVARIVSVVEGKPAEEKIRYFHDYLVNHCGYDYTHAKSRAYDCLIGGSSVCNGYAAAFHNLCTVAGLEASYIAGTVEVEGQGRIAHAWNRVKAEDGQWRYYDVTFDDSTSSYRYYGITEEEMGRDHFPEEII